jgi:hypothetical protein
VDGLRLLELRSSLPIVIATVLLRLVSFGNAHAERFKDISRSNLTPVNLPINDTIHNGIELGSKLRVYIFQLVRVFAVDFTLSPEFGFVQTLPGRICAFLPEFNFREHFLRIGGGMVSVRRFAKFVPLLVGLANEYFGLLAVIRIFQVIDFLRLGLLHEFFNIPVAIRGTTG